MYSSCIFASNSSHIIFNIIIIIIIAPTFRRLFARAGFRTSFRDIPYPGPTLGMSWCSDSFDRYALKSFTLSLCDLLAMD